MSKQNGHKHKDAVRYGSYATQLGQMLLARSEQGICRLSLGDDAAALAADLRAHHPAALAATDDGHLRRWAQHINSWLRGQRAVLDLPLDLQGSAFQRAVWQQLRAIPPGATRSYSDIAAALQQPRATRAVATACARNPVALLIPCHRVLRKDGKLGGYRWGMQRKQALLTLERERAPV